MTQELVLSDQTYMPAMSIPQAVARFNTLVEFVQTVMRQDVDYGVIPGTPKPTLLKPGAEKLTTLFGLTTRFVVVEKTEDWTGEDHGGEPFFYYWYRCQLWRGDRLIAEADGSCNSREAKYRWRWVQAQDIPEGLSTAKLAKRGGTTSEFDFAIEKAETSGQYGKPIEYWQTFRTAIENGTARAIKRKTKNGREMDAWEIDTTVYRIPNDNICDQVNTLQKMSQKRALIAATLIGVNASEFFTQDVEDIATIGNGASYVPPVQVVNTGTGEVIDQEAQDDATFAARLNQKKPAPKTPQDAADRFFLRYRETVGGTSWEAVQRYLGSRAPQPTTVNGWIAAAEAVRDKAKEVEVFPEIVPPSDDWSAEYDAIEAAEKSS